jgi:hypothetical protein
MKMIKRNSVRTEDICFEYLKENATVKSVSEIFGMHYDSVRKRLVKSENKDVLSKMKYNSTKSIKKNPSKIIEINENSFGIVPNNNSKSIHTFPIRLKSIMENIGWSEDKFGYLCGNIGGKKMKGYLLVVGSPIHDNYEIDHINNDITNNLENNLRIITRELNLQNKQVPKNNTSGFKGVTYNKRKKKWVATINISKTNFFLGLFDNKEDAAWTRLDFKYNLFGFEFMSNIESSQYVKLLNERNGVHEV